MFTMEILEFCQQALRVHFETIVDVLKESNKERLEIIERITFGSQQIKEDSSGFIQTNSFDGEDMAGLQGVEREEIKQLIECQAEEEMKEDFVGFTQTDFFNAEQAFKQEITQEQAGIIRQLLDIDQQKRLEQILREEIPQRDSVKSMLFEEIQSLQIVYYEVKNDWIDLWKLVKRQIFEYALQFDTKD